MVESMAWGIVALIVLLALSQSLVEWSTLRRLVILADRPDRLHRAIRSLGNPYRRVFSTFVDSHERAASIDEALARALVQGAQSPFSAPLFFHIFAVILTVGAIFAPAVSALLQAATTVVELFDEGRTQSVRSRYLYGATGLHPAFVELGEAFETTAWLTAALAVAWALRWWLLRPEVREARLTRALIECAGRMKPGASAPVSTRLAELIAPDRGLARPVLATAMWTVAVTVGWLALIGGAQIRIASQRPRPFAVWPPESARRIEIYHGVVLPRAHAGAPLVRTERPSLTFGPSEVFFHNVSMMRLVDGRTPANWAESAPELARSLADFPRPLEVTVLAHRSVKLDVVVPVLRRLAARYDIAKYHLILERDVGTPDGGRLQSVLPLEVRSERESTLLKMHIEATGVQISPTGAFVPFESKDWRTDLRDEIRASPALRESPQAPVVALAVGSEMLAQGDYRRLIGAMSAADSSCADRFDCGLPGLGLRFTIAP